MLNPESICIADPADLTDHHSAKIEAALHHALDRGQMRVAYQPQVCVATGQITGAEALLRWDHPERGAVPPGYFIPLATQRTDRPHRRLGARGGLPPSDGLVDDLR